MKRSYPRIALIGSLLLFLLSVNALPLQGQDRPVKREGRGAEGEKVPAPPVYPRLTALHREQAKHLLTAFKNRNPKKRAEAEKKMIAIGRSVVPFLLEKITTRHASQGECIYRCLRALMDRRDLYILQRCAASKCARERRLAAEELAELAEPSTPPLLKRLLRDEVPRIRRAAALGLAAMRDPAGLGEIVRAVAEDLEHPDPRLLRPLPLLKGNVYGSLFFPFLSDKEKPEVRRAAIRVILEIGDTRLKTALGRALDDPHNLVKAAAVNALRRILHHEPPRDYGNVFELVEAVDRWKKELGIAR